MAAKRRLLQWMRDRLNSHADKVVIPTRHKKALDTAYAKAAPLVLATVAKRFPVADMKVLQRYQAGDQHDEIRLQFPNGVVTEFKFDKDAGPYTPDAKYSRQIYLADAATAAAVDRWEVARGEYEEERKKRLAAYTALIAGSGYVEDIIDLWPEAKNILPVGSPPIPLGPEQLAIVKADLRERVAA
jgi:hypothetical protein